ncbi:hypothetical protein [Granulicella aggregans]|uniref:hypothetical protein n=1 Tax=Granulicella aggregans TaxID=474949 RepID=UPI0021DF8E4B|nr:hypothetical protein [Granulicella aggregans]
MSESKLEFPEVVGKMVAELSVIEDPEFGKEVLVRFADGTQLSIAVGVRQVIDARYCNEEMPDLPISHRQSL